MLHRIVQYNCQEESALVLFFPHIYLFTFVSSLQSSVPTCGCVRNTWWEDSMYTIYLNKNFIYFFALQKVIKLFYTTGIWAVGFGASSVPSQYRCPPGKQVVSLQVTIARLCKTVQARWWCALKQLTLCAFMAYMVSGRNICNLIHARSLCLHDVTLWLYFVLSKVISPSCNDDLTVKKDQCLVRSFADSKL